MSVIKVLFICHGNICRSPMAEFMLKDMAAKAGLSEQFQIDSAAISTEEIGNPMYPPARKKLEEHGIVCEKRAARQLTDADYWDYDLIIGMDEENMRGIKKICGADLSHKCALMMNFTDRPRTEVADPWYTRDFDQTYRDLEDGCKGLLSKLRRSV